LGGLGLRQTPRENDFLGKFGANPAVPAVLSRGPKDRKDKSNIFCGKISTK